MSGSAAQEAHRILKIDAPILVDDRDLMDEALDLALSTGQALYDCLYLALSLRQGCEMITADRKFHAAVAAEFPNVLPL
jgi:predicted nucleic acid-binding protein